MPDKVLSATDLLSKRDSIYDAATLFRAMERAGLLAVIEYPSTTGTGEVKTFKALTEKGLAYGENKKTVHDFKTECRFYDAAFDELLKASGLK